MASRVTFKASVERDLRKLDPADARKVLGKIEKELAKDPTIGEPLKGDFRGLYRYRIGDHRVIYAKTRDGILVLRIGHRKDVYR